MGGNCRERERNCPSGIKFRDLSLKRVTLLFPNMGTKVGNAGESTRSEQRWVFAASTPSQDQAGAVPVQSIGRDLEPLYCYNLNPHSAKNPTWNVAKLQNQTCSMF